MRQTKKSGNGKLIVLEGITCAGKTTLGKMLVDDLTGRAIPAVFNHEPTELLFGAIVRAVAEKRPAIDPFLLRTAKLRIESFADKKNGLASFDRRLLAIVNRLFFYGDLIYGRAAELSYEDLQILFIADRREDLLENIIPKIGQGITIAQDRYEMSTFAFGMATGVPYEKIAAWHAKALQSVYVKPDAVFYIDIPPREGLEKSGKTIDIYEEKLERLRKIRKNYLYLLDTRRFKNAVIIDGRRKLESVFEDLKLLTGKVIGKPR